MFWSGSSTSDFCKIIKDSHCGFEADSNQNNHLSGRRVADESDYKRSRNSQGYIDFSTAESRLCNKSAEICSGALAKDRVSRSGNRLSENGINTTTGKSKKIETEMPKAYFKPQNDTMGSERPFRFSLLNSTDSATSYATNQVFTTAANSSYKKNPSYQSAMYLNQDSLQELQWWFNNQEICNGKLIVSNLQNSDTIRCLQKGLGAYCQKVSIGGQWSLQESSLHINVLELLAIKLAFLTLSNVLSQINPFPGRQYECPFLPDENGGYIKQGDDSHFQRDLGIRIVQRYRAYCRVPAGQIERQGRLCFQKCISKSIPKNLCKVGIPRVGSFCIKSMPSDTILPVVESRSTQPSNRCIPTKLETSGPTVCFFPFFSDKESPIKGQNREGGCNSNNTKLASTTLIQSSSGIICKRTSASTSFKQHLSKSSGPSTPSDCEQNSKTSGLESFRQSLASEGISARAAELIAGARRPGALFNYESACRKWVSWCGEREINPHSCHLNFVLDFLAQLFEKTFEYSTINTYRSALSAYHDKVDNQPVGKRPKFVI